MEYESLNKLFYKNNQRYEEEYLRLFTSPSTIHYDFLIKNNQAFLVLTEEVLNLCLQIWKNNCILNNVAGSIPPIALSQFTRKILVDEVRLTNEIEGIHSTRKEIQQVMDMKNDGKKTKRLYGLVQKYIKLMDDEEIQLSDSNDIRKLYDEFILDEIKSESTQNLPDGKIFRKDGVEVLSETQKPIHKGVYPESEIIKSMDNALNILNDKSHDCLLNISVFHYLFGYIHPFYDGNGRMSRFISSYMISTEINVISALLLSTEIKQNISKYYKAFSITNDEKNKGDLTHFVILFLNLINDATINAYTSICSRKEKLDYFDDKSEELIAMINSNIKHESIENIIFILVQNALFADRGLRIFDLCKICELGESTVRKVISEIPENFLRIEKDGHTQYFDIDLDMLTKI